MKKILVDAIHPRLDVTIFLSHGGLWHVLETVRNLVLDWCLQLESAGIVGEDMSATEEERRDADRVTNHFIIQNVGVLGDVSGQATVSNAQTAINTIDVGAVRDSWPRRRLLRPRYPQA